MSTTIKYTTCAVSGVLVYGIANGLALNLMRYVKDYLNSRSNNKIEPTTKNGETVTPDTEPKLEQKTFYLFDLRPFFLTPKSAVPKFVVVNKLGMYLAFIFGSGLITAGISNLFNYSKWPVSLFYTPALAVYLFPELVVGSFCKPIMMEVQINTGYLLLYSSPCILYLLNEVAKILKNSMKKIQGGNGLIH